MTENKKHIQKELRIRKDITANIVVNGNVLNDYLVYANDNKEVNDMIIIIKDKGMENTIQLTFQKSQDEQKNEKK